MSEIQIVNRFSSVKTISAALILCSAICLSNWSQAAFAKQTARREPKPATSAESSSASAAIKRKKGTALTLLQKAAVRGDAAAQFQLAVLYERGSSVPKDLNKAIELYKRSSDGDYALAQFYLGFLYQTGDGVLQDLRKAAELYQKSANQGDARALFFLGSLYENGTGVPKNTAKAVELYQAAVARGDGAAALHLGSMYENGLVVGQDLKQAVRLYIQAAGKGSDQARQNLKRLQAAKAATAPRAPSTWTKPRAQRDDLDRAYEDAMSYVWGMNRVKLDTQEAVIRLETLAKSGCPEAEAQLAEVAKRGNWPGAVPQDENAAEELAQIALADGLAERADEGRPNAQFRLGVLYNYGLGFPEDQDKGWELSAQAAEGGCVGAQFYLGKSYFDPIENYGTDLSKAVPWYEKAAAQGMADAQYFLAIMHMRGLGVPEDIQKAEQLFQQAANQGHEQAGNELQKVTEIQQCSRAIADNPDAEAYYKRGYAYSKINEYERAIKDFDKAVSLKPDYADAYRRRGYCLSRLDRDEAAIKSFDQAIALKPDYARAYVGRGTCYFALKRHEEALKSVDQAIEIDPDCADYYFIRALILSDTKQYDRALSDLDKTIAIKPDYADAYYYRGEIYNNLAQYEKAIVEFDRALQLKPDYEKAQALRDLASSKLKEK